MALRPDHRRPEFDEIVEGWGTDELVDLTARAELLVEYFRCLGGFTAAEQKIERAMQKRLVELGGTWPAAKNSAENDGPDQARGHA